MVLVVGWCGEIGDRWASRIAAAIQVTNCQWEVAGIAGTSTPSPATSDCQLGIRV